MKTTFTKSYILKHRGCYQRAEALKLSFINNKPITIEDIFNSEISLKDKYWFFIKKCNLTHKEKVEVAVRCAEIVLPIYEKRGNSKAPREAILLVNRWIWGEEITTAELRAAADSAYSANAAAYAANAAAADYAGDAGAYAGAYAVAVAVADADADAAYALQKNLFTLYHKFNGTK